ncbi:uncharacterized protein LOC100898699 [Galendromus occidentalis]|uniref:Uncharacterized protein LOC100898699 n=1 Tax=Galendromus occidentalis TaxID=34638 RepID=A0AAJ6QTW1_9ACAR|nr:uncharacterized protein LOC100898699 [Galendromus occidentalis]
MELGKRLINTTDESEVSKLIETGERDCVIVSSEGKGFPTYVELLKLMSPYFSCILQEGWTETRRKVIKTKISKNSLESIVHFMEYGEILLSASNIGLVYLVAEYFQLECLMEECRHFLTKRMSEILGKVIAIGTKHPLMVSLAEEALDYITEHISESKTNDQLILLTPEMIASVLSRDELNVKSEDEVCDIVVKWLGTRPDTSGILTVVECIRLPHLTKDSFERLKSALGDSISVPSIELINCGKLLDLPEDQLARRLIFQFVAIMNTLHMITHSKNFNHLLVFQQQKNGRWIQRIKYRREEPMPDFAESVDGTELSLSIFDGFCKPLKTLQFEPLSFADAKIVEYQPPMELNFSPPRMILRKEVAIYLLDSSVKICDRLSGEVATIPRAPGCEKLRFTDILLHDDKLYAYEELNLELRDRDFNPIHDRLYVISLETKQIESVVEVVLPTPKTRPSPVLQGDRYKCPKMLIVGSRLTLYKYFAARDCVMIVEFDAEKQVFNKIAEIPCSDRETYYNKIVTLLPLHLHRCRSETLLQEYCGSLRDPAQGAELSQLLFYL